MLSFSNVHALLLLDGLALITTLESRFIRFMMEEEFSKTIYSTSKERDALEKTRRHAGPHYPIVVKLDFRVTPHVTQMFLGEDFLASKSLPSDTMSDEHTKALLRARPDPKQLLFYGTAPFGTEGYPITSFYHQ